MSLVRLKWFDALPNGPERLKRVQAVLKDLTLEQQATFLLTCCVLVMRQVGAHKAELVMALNKVWDENG